MTRFIFLLLTTFYACFADAQSASNVAKNLCPQEQQRISANKLMLMRQRAELDLRGTALKEEANRLLKADEALQNAGKMLESEQAALQTARGQLNQPRGKGLYAQEIGAAQNQKEAKLYNLKVADYNRRRESYNEKAEAHLRASDAHGQHVATHNRATQELNSALKKLRASIETYNQSCTTPK